MTSRIRVLVVDDEAAILRFLRPALEANNYEMASSGTVAESTRRIASEPPDIVVLDLGLPDGDGIDLTRRLRTWTAVPIIVISARGRESDKVEALDAGADDYLTKPFGLDELLARMRVALRHARLSASSAPEPVVTIGSLRVDFDSREASVDGRPVRLTPIEWRLLAYLARHAGKVVTHGQILKDVWGEGSSAEPHHVRVHMAGLRKKIEADPARPRLIRTEPGVGYRLRDTESP
jgi:two-component system, OmpR family, KDP operon response regulator KdpE